MNDPTTKDVRTIKGRNRYADAALTTVRILRHHKEVLVIEGGYLETRGDGFVIAAKHPSATDREGDSSYVATIDGAGLAWKDMCGSTHTFTGVLLEAAYLEDEEAQAFIDRHGYLKFTPPAQQWQPGVYTIEVEHLAGREPRADS